MATHPCILAWRIPWTEEPGRLYSPWSPRELDTTERLILSDVLGIIIALKSYYSAFPETIIIIFVS